MLRAAVAASAAAVLAGCGGGSSAYSLGKTRACLGKLTGAKLSSRVDFVASTAPGGAVHVHLPGTQAVTISFGDTVDEATRIADAYRRFRGRNIGIEDVLRETRNAVLLWHEHPSADDEAIVTGCLK